MTMVRGGFFLGWLIAWVTMAIAATATGRAAPASAYGSFSERIEGKDYWDAGTVGRRFGLTAEPLARGKALMLKGSWTRIALEVGSQEMQINGLRVYLSDPVAADHGRFFISRRDVQDLLRPILLPGAAPLPPRVRTIVIDPGHGGNDHGNENRRLKLQEKTMTLDVARRLAHLLAASGYRVVMTRNDDRYVELDDRVALAARVRADLFVSVHFNSFTQPDVTGAETYVMTPRFDPSAPAPEHDKSMRTADFPGNGFDRWNAVLGYKMQSAVVRGLGAADRGFKRYRYYVLRMSPCPAVLVESAFLSNDAEGRKVATSVYRERIAQAISEGVKVYAATVDRYRSEEVASRRGRR